MNYYEDNGRLKIKQLDKRILTRGSWVTAVFKYGRIYWIELDGSMNAVNRFFVEVKLISELFPLFNAKAEH